MDRTTLTACAIVIGAITMPVDATRIARSQSAKRAFAAATACPSTGVKALPCPGYVIDHIKPLACGGADAPSNMQWQTIADGKAKDKWERKQCSK